MVRKGDGERRIPTLHTPRSVRENGSMYGLDLVLSVCTNAPFEGCIIPIEFNCEFVTFVLDYDRDFCFTSLTVIIE